MKRLAPLILLICMASCQKLLLRYYVSQNKTANLFTYTNGKTSMIFITAAHVGKPEFYADIKAKIDSLRTNGYTILYEGLTLDYIHTDSVKLDTYLRKFKKLTGIYISKYDNKKNKTLKIPEIKGMIIQTNENTGINEKFDINADREIVELIDIYERRFGEIQLSACDRQADLNETYRCSKIDRDKRYQLMNTLRNEKIVEVMNGLKTDKIVILYGMKHIYGVRELLQKQDSAWHFVPRTSGK